MIGALKRSWDNFRGSGEAAVTVPPMDGALRPNRIVEEAPLVLATAAPDDLAAGRDGVLFSSGTDVLLLGKDGGAPLPVLEFDAPVTALAASPGGGIAAALASGRIVIASPGGQRRTLERLGDAPAQCVTALAFASEDELLVAQGSARRPAAQWKRDLMERRADGSLWSVALNGDGQTLMAGDLGWPFGIAAADDGRILVAESWKHRLVAVAGGRAPEPVLSDLPGYPARLHRDRLRGGYWLAVFAPRNQIIEFIQREPAFLSRMMAGIDEAYWAAPSLAPPSTFLEPLQGGAQKHLGMLKPWAPTRSYGLVVRLDASLRPVGSAHSRADGTRHGILTCLPAGDTVLAASKGGDAIVGIDPQLVAATPRKAGDE